jgi:hypothetical protein
MLPCPIPPRPAGRARQLNSVTNLIRLLRLSRALSLRRMRAIRDCRRRIVPVRFASRQSVRTKGPIYSQLSTESPRLRARQEAARPCTMQIAARTAFLRLCSGRSPDGRPQQDRISPGCACGHASADAEASRRAVLPQAVATTECQYVPVASTRMNSGESPSGL